MSDEKVVGWVVRRPDGEFAAADTDFDAFATQEAAIDDVRYVGDRVCKIVEVPDGQGD